MLLPVKHKQCTNATLKCSIGLLSILSFHFMKCSSREALRLATWNCYFTFSGKWNVPYLLFTRGFLEVTDKQLWWKYSKIFTVFDSCLTFVQPDGCVSTFKSLLLAETRDAPIIIFAADTDFWFLVVMITIIQALFKWYVSSMVTVTVNSLKTEGIFSDLTSKWHT